MKIFLVYLLLMNIAGFAAMGIDKCKAKAHAWRIPETVDLFGEYVFFCGESFNEKSAYSKENYAAIAQIMTVISSSDDITEMIEKTR